MPKQRITHEMIVEAAFELLREGGARQVVVKQIASRLGCSVQPIYSYCSSMDGLHRDLEARAAEFVRAYLAQRIRPEDLFRSTGYAYARLAQEEPEVFKLYVLRRREGIASLKELYASEANPAVAGAISRALDIGEDAARRMHLAMMIFNVGMGTIMANASPGIPMEEAGAQLEEAYRAFAQLAAGKKGEE